MKKIPFDLNKWFSDKSQKVETRDGRPARIVCWDMKLKIGDVPKPIIALITCDNGNETSAYYTADGYFHFYDDPNRHDLFLVTEDEPKLTEFEEVLRGIIYDYSSGDKKLLIDDIKEDAAKLLAIVRKQLKAEGWEYTDPLFKKVCEEKLKQEPIPDGIAECIQNHWWEMEEVVNYDKEIADLCDGTMSLTSKDIAKYFYNLGKSEALKEQKPAEPKAYLDLSMDAIEACMLRYLQSAANRKNDCEVIEDTREYKKQLVDLIQKPDEVETPANLDLEKEIDKTVNECTDGYNFDWDKFAQHFYELGRNSKPAEWSEDYREEDLQTRFAFYTYKDEPSVLHLSNLFVEEASRNRGLGTKILKAAEKVAEMIGASLIGLRVKQDSPANAWYRKNGYGYVASEDGYDWLEKKLEYIKPWISC